MPSSVAHCVPGGTRTTSVVAVGAVALGALAVAAALGLEVRAGAGRTAGRAASRRRRARRRRRGRRRRRRGRPWARGPRGGSSCSRRRRRRPGRGCARSIVAACSRPIVRKDRRHARRRTSSSSPAPRPASAPRPPATPRRPATGSCSPPARPTSSTRSPTSSAATSARSPSRCDVTEWERAGGAWSRARSTRFGRLDVVFANAGFGAPRGFVNETPEHWRAMVLTNVSAPPTRSARRCRPSRETHGPPAADRARSPAAARSRARSTRPRSGRSPRWARRCARSSTAPACA